MKFSANKHEAEQPDGFFKVVTKNQYTYIISL